MSLSCALRGHTRWVALAVAVAPAVLAGTLVAALGVGAFGFVTPVLAVAAVIVLRMLVSSATTRQSRLAVREIGCVAVAVLAGFGTWVAGIVLGMMVEVLPFIGDGNYPYADAWFAGCVVVAVMWVPLVWWLVRRAVDPDLP